MGQNDNDQERRGSEPTETAEDSRRPTGRPLSPREVWRLIAATYRTSFPYLLIFIAGLLLATWLITELVF